MVKHICLLSMDHNCKRFTKSVPSLEIQTVYPTTHTSCLLFCLHFVHTLRHYCLKTYRTKMNVIEGNLLR